LAERIIPLTRREVFLFGSGMRFGERIIPFTGGDVLLYGSDVSNAAVIWIMWERDMELSSLVECQNRNHMFVMEILPGAAVFDPATHANCY